MTQPETVIVKVEMFKVNLDRITGAAAINGESITEAINRACVFYEVFSTASKFHRVRWRDVTGTEHKALIYK